jgi:hypothetical protein
MSLKVPMIDGLVQQAVENPQVDGKEKDQVISIFNKMCSIAPQGNDEFRKIWITADRGKITDFGSFAEYKEEGTVHTKKEFHDLWLWEYPEKQKWYSVTVTKYKEVVYLYINSELAFSTDKEKDSTPPPLYPRSNTKLLTWLSAEVGKVIKEIKADPMAYNKRIEKYLPYQKRIGKIKRSDYWAILPEEGKRIKKKLKPADIKILELLQATDEESEVDDPSTIIKSMTAGKFFRYCEMGYDSNGYFKKEAKLLSPKEKYGRMADGRDCGLKSIRQNSVQAFKEWYEKESNCGGHPWEICRGGNSTHISLYVVRKECGWQLQLAGLSDSRIIETVKIAVALYKNKVPFQLLEAKAILQFVTGKDFLGIVPEDVTPRYCHSLFPDEDDINDYMNLDESKKSEIARKATWYPEIQASLP